MPGWHRPAEVLLEAEAVAVKTMRRWPCLGAPKGLNPKGRPAAWPTDRWAMRLRAHRQQRPYLLLPRGRAMLPRVHRQRPLFLRLAQGRGAL